jgi:ribulose-5-phosphate 4-epimerase/fuculose-1-phosphate aldolase
MLKQFQRATWKVVDLVNSPRKTQKITRSAVASRVIFNQFLGAARIADGKNYFAGSLGEMSMRASGGKILINSKNIPFSMLDEETLLLAGSKQGQPDEELELPNHIDWHRLVYQYSEAAAVMLCQPRYLMYLANRLESPSKGILKDADALIAQLAITPETKITEESIRTGSDILLIPFIGVLLWGQTLAQLIDRLEILERVCAISALEK